MMKENAWQSEESDLPSEKHTSDNSRLIVIDQLDTINVASSLESKREVEEAQPPLCNIVNVPSREQQTETKESARSDVIVLSGANGGS